MRGRIASSTSANEIHVPAGEPVRLVLNSTDVIHSFWVPNLAGKLDLIPGRENVLSFVAADSRAPIAASAPSSAVRSTRIWASSSWPSRGRPSMHGATEQLQPRPSPHTR